MFDTSDMKNIIPTKITDNEANKHLIPTQVINNIYEKIPNIPSALYDKVSTEHVNNLYKYYAQPPSISIPKIPITPDTIETTLSTILLTLLGASIFVPINNIGGKTNKKKRL